MNNVIGVFFYLVILILTILIYRKSDEFEPSLMWKLIGYTILGGFSFQFNEWKLPFGFLIYLLFFRNIKVNAKAKKRAVYLGLVIYVISTIVPWVQTYIYEQPKEIQVQNTNFYEGSLAQEWENIQSKLGEVGNTSKVIDFNMEISDKGKIRDLTMDIEERTMPEKSRYHITLSDHDKTFIVERKKVGTEAIHIASETLTETPFFLKQLDLIEKPMLDEKGIDAYHLKASGQRTRYSQIDVPAYLIDTAGKREMKNSELPTDAIVVTVCHGNCKGQTDFLFDVLNKIPQLTEDNILDIAQQQSSEIKDWLIKHRGDKLGLEKDGSIFLTKDGNKEEVKKETYYKVLTETPEVAINQNGQKWEVTVKTPYGDQPHQLEFVINEALREVEWVRFK
ncbi:hypothetical protein [Guptibacillus spartinae]|uniref:hypothetical protein n=1 Tax=Guptibacillus spartinae TaxID=3025679 RepID=UPI0023630FAD|nr:hypothetical protein [Pseudalkalibacillus spartinae]